MAIMYKRCDPDNCCKDEDHGKPADKPESRGKKITAASSTTCKGSTAKGAGSSCKCAFVKHFREYIRDHEATKRSDTGYLLRKEEIHGYSDSGWDQNNDKWSDEDGTKLIREEKEWKDIRDGASDIQLLLICLEVDRDGKPIEINEFG